MTAGTVTLGAKRYLVAVMEETVRRTIYRVTMEGPRSKAWRPAEVRVGEESVFVCLVCRQHPDRPCLHIVVVRLFVAGQSPVALSPVPSLEAIP
jgi:hypothetical protein